MKSKENKKEKILEKEISEEMRSAYIDYAMSVIVSRALPDVRDGLKPVQRRILYAMYEDGLRADGKFKKAATVVGSTLGKYHPHGDQPVYDAAIRMAQNFTLRYPLIQGQGNIGSIDNPEEYAAMRYVEMKLSKIGEEMLRDIEKETVDFTLNYDGTRKEPVVLPAPIPNLILNGALGIAVGMATNIPPHNLKEVCDALCYLIDHPKADIEEISKILPGPDFPTGGLVFDKEEILKAYAQGRGKILVRAKTEIVEDGQRKKIVITEIPYQVSKTTLLENLAKIVEEKKIEGIKNIRDESDREGLRVVIELEKGVSGQVVLNGLFKFTDLQKVYYLNMVALSPQLEPKLYSLVEILQEFIEHRKEVVKRRASYDLKKAKERAHVLIGIAKCLSKIDLAISLIKNSKDKREAQEKLKKAFKIDDLQANAILEIKLASLAKMEREKIKEELEFLKQKIREYESILKNPKLVKEIIKKELKEIKEKFGDERKTKIVKEKMREIKEEDLIPQEEVLVTLTKEGYIKRVSLQEFKLQKRGARGILGIKTKEEDFVQYFTLANTKHTLLLFSNQGRVFSLPVFDLPKEKRESKGKPISTFLHLKKDEKIISLLPLDKDTKEKGSLLFLTLSGKIKKTPISHFQKLRSNGILGISLKKGDILLEVKKVKEGDEILVFSKEGQVIRFKEKEVREMGRTAEGVRGISLKKGDFVQGMEILPSSLKKKIYILSISEFGFGKKTPLEEYRIQKRGGKGILATKINEKTGKLVALKAIFDQKELILISKNGQTLRTEISAIPVLSRMSRGAKLMKMENDKIISAICY